MAKTTKKVQKAKKVRVGVRRDGALVFGTAGAYVPAPNAPRADVVAAVREYTSPTMKHLFSFQRFAVGACERKDGAPLALVNVRVQEMADNGEFRTTELGKGRVRGVDVFHVPAKEKATARQAALDALGLALDHGAEVVVLFLDGREPIV